MKAEDLRDVQRVLWAAADEMRANSSLAPAEYRGPVRGQLTTELGNRVDLEPGALVWLPRRSRRQFSAGPAELRYRTVHQRREALVLHAPVRRLCDDRWAGSDYSAGGAQRCEFIP
jgi:hypothetical protein